MSLFRNNGSIDLYINKPGGISFIQLLAKVIFKMIYIKRAILKLHFQYKTIPGHLRKLQSGQTPTDSQSEWAVLKKY
jgi:hypothetical protein